MTDSAHLGLREISVMNFSQPVDGAAVMATDDAVVEAFRVGWKSNTGSGFGGAAFGAGRAQYRLAENRFDGNSVEGFGADLALLAGATGDLKWSVLSDGLASAFGCALYQEGNGEFFGGAGLYMEGNQISGNCLTVQYEMPFGTGLSMAITYSNEDDNKIVNSTGWQLSLNSVYNNYQSANRAQERVGKPPKPRPYVTISARVR